MKTLIEKQRTGLIKKFHALCGKLGLTEDERILMLVKNYGVTSSLYLRHQDLLQVCGWLEMEVNPELKKLDENRKRLMASIAGWLRAMNLREDMNNIKGIACRAANRKTFNDIPLETLRSLYYAFKKKQKDLQMVEFMTAEQIELLSLQN